MTDEVEKYFYFKGVLYQVRKRPDTWCGHYLPKIVEKAPLQPPERVHNA